MTKTLNKYIKNNIYRYYDIQYIRNYSLDELTAELSPEAVKEIKIRANKEN